MNHALVKAHFQFRRNAIPGFFRSKIVKHLETDFLEGALVRFWILLYRFMNYTLSSSSDIEFVSTRRATICKDIMSAIPCPSAHCFDTSPTF